MSKLDAAIQRAHATPAHPFTVAVDGDGNRTYAWACPEACVHSEAECPMIQSLRTTDVTAIAGELPPGQYAAVFELWDPTLIYTDGSPASDVSLRVEPSSCRWCGIPQLGHGRQWTSRAGWHAWDRPTQQQIKDRMRVRRNSEA